MGRCVAVGSDLYDLAYALAVDARGDPAAFFERTQLMYAAHRLPFSAAHLPVPLCTPVFDDVRARINLSASREITGPETSELFVCPRCNENALRVWTQQKRGADEETSVRKRCYNCGYSR
jgi:predicted RNA-binding Zn-ribbon protein involved in translation (DUF1610 family)